MGLSIRLSAMEEEHPFFLLNLSQLQEVLESHNLEMYQENTDVTAGAARAMSFHPEFRDYGYVSHPYSFLTHLRRAAVRHRIDSDWVFEPIEDPNEDEHFPHFYVDYFDEPELLDNHLLFHSDCDGFYLPVDFQTVIQHKETYGSYIGSSYSLLRELKALAPTLDITFDGEEPLLGDVIRDEGPGHRVLNSWFAHYEAARLSIQLQTAIIYT